MARAMHTADGIGEIPASRPLCACARYAYRVGSTVPCLLMTCCVHAPPVFVGLVDVAVRRFEAGEKDLREAEKLDARVKPMIEQWLRKAEAGPRVLGSTAAYPVRSEPAGPSVRAPGGRRPHNDDDLPGRLPHRFDLRVPLAGDDDRHLLSEVDRVPPFELRDLFRGAGAADHMPAVRFAQIRKRQAPVQAHRIRAAGKVRHRRSKIDRLLGSGQIPVTRGRKTKDRNGANFCRARRARVTCPALSPGTSCRCRASFRLSGTRRQRRPPARPSSRPGRRDTPACRSGRSRTSC